MGLYLFSRSAHDRYGQAESRQAESPPPLPDPTRYQILRHEQVGRYLVLSLQYLDCTNYEGRKILLYADCTLAQLKRQRVIDPHFCDNPKYHAPIARFVPTADGWAMAMGVAQGLHQHGAHSCPTPT